VSLRRGGLVAIALAILLAALFGPPGIHLLSTWARDRRDRPTPPSGYIDDASGLNRTKVAEVWDIPRDSTSAEAKLRALLERARRDHLHVSIGGALHSMGGQSIAKDGVFINMLPFHGMVLDEGRHLLHVEAGALWSEVIPFLNARGLSVGVMQSNNSFTVGGSISVNCHGWQTQGPPIASTVERLRILCADGLTRECSRTENPELFSLALGGYGLFGVILDVDLRVVPNEGYHLERTVVQTAAYPKRFTEKVGEGSDVMMAYGRLSVAPETFLNEALLSVYHRVPGTSGRPSPVSFPEVRWLTRELFRGQVGSPYGKSLRWRAEKNLGGAFSEQTVFRNELLSEPVEVFDNRSSESTDILHEYFVPRESFGLFVEDLRSIAARHRADLLNVTVRDVVRDDDTFLRYADREMFALVLLFNVPRTPEADSQSEAMTRELIDASCRRGGRFYLPYRLHATPAQLRLAYPRIARFLELKLRYDPQEVFQNSFYAKYASAFRE